MPHSGAFPADVSRETWLIQRPDAGGTVSTFDVRRSRSWLNVKWAGSACRFPAGTHPNGPSLLPRPGRGGRQSAAGPARQHSDLI